MWHGRLDRCKRCRSAHRYRTDPEFRARAKAAVLKRLHNNRDAINARTRELYHMPGSRKKASVKRWMKNNPEKVKASMAAATKKRFGLIAAAYGIPIGSVDRRYRRVLGGYLLEHSVCMNCAAAAKLEVHHIKPVLTHPHLAMEESNFMALCHKCHINAERIRKGQEPLP